MSQTTDKYDKKKLEDPNIVYVFKQGGFYRFLKDDCDKISKLFNFKPIEFAKDSIGNQIYSCGFPINSKEDYLSQLDKMKIKYEIIEPEENTEKPKKSKTKANISEEIAEEIRSIDLMSLSEREAFIKICGWQAKLK